MRYHLLLSFIELELAASEIHIYVLKTHLDSTLASKRMYFEFEEYFFNL